MLAFACPAAAAAAGAVEALRIARRLATRRCAAESCGAPAAAPSPQRGLSEGRPTPLLLGLRLLVAAAAPQGGEPQGGGPQGGGQGPSPQLAALRGEMAQLRRQVAVLNQRASRLLECRAAVAPLEMCKPRSLAAELGVCGMMAADRALVCAARGGEILWERIPPLRRAAPLLPAGLPQAVSRFIGAAKERVAAPEREYEASRRVYQRAFYRVNSLLGRIASLEARAAAAEADAAHLRAAAGGPPPGAVCRELPPGCRDAPDEELEAGAPKIVPELPSHRLPSLPPRPFRPSEAPPPSELRRATGR
eukprot:TRINITY_DN36499_c0_g1_i1.p1 TRINITY_DN36499_c0_g1~~TRINITY_DN36499_c0_g1_i1.p1  ORF type:complete len:306 (+),score=70.11 TRINITY_DN36499_c0_g1_i1:72-989(+)